MNTNTEIKTDGAKRFDAEKIRVDLIPARATEEVGKVFTFGAKRYGDRNWEKGMDWTRMIASSKRHLLEIEKGEDYDRKSGLLHSAHLACNSLMLTEYYHIHQKGDNRRHTYLRMERVGLDIDEVLADFIGHYKKHFKIDKNVPFWFFDSELKKNLEELKNNNEFWSTIPPKIDPKDLPFEPVCYITSRICDIKFTEKWLTDNGFPSVPVYVVQSEEKAKIATEQKLTMFVDDRFETFVQMTKANIFCYLMNAPHNEKYKVGHKRIHSLNEIK
jgi:hypothetical protein